MSGYQVAIDNTEIPVIQRIETPAILITMIAQQGLPGAGGDGSSILYNGASPSTVTVGGLVAGSAIAGSSIEGLLQSMLVPFIAPSFASFAMVGQATAVEVGTTIAGSKSFAFGFTASANVTANTLTILDATAGTVVTSGQPLSSPITVAIGTVTLNAPGVYAWQGRAANTQGTVFSSGLFTVGWYWRMFAGTSTNGALTASQVQALAGNALASSKNSTVGFAGGGYKYFAWPDSFGAPTAGTGFKDTATNLAVAMADSTDNTAYSSTQNGWSYASVSVTNANGIATIYRVYRTKNVLGSSINIQVS